MFTNNEINKNSPLPMYYQLETLILDKIHSGELNPGDMLPTELDIAEIFSLSRTTVRQAIQNLVNKGLIYRIKGTGTFISEPKLLQEFMNKLESFNDQIRRLNLTPSTKLLSIKVIPAIKEVAQILGTNSDQLIEIIRIRYANELPIVYVKTYLPLSCSFILNHDLEKESLYTLLNQYKETRVIQVTRQLEAILASPKLAEHLEIAEGLPIQFTTTIGTNEKQRPIEYSLAYYPGDKNKFIVHLKV